MRRARCYPVAWMIALAACDNQAAWQFGEDPASFPGQCEASPPIALSSVSFRQVAPVDATLEPDEPLALRVDVATEETGSSSCWRVALAENWAGSVVELNLTDASKGGRYQPCTSDMSRARANAQVKLGAGAHDLVIHSGNCYDHYRIEVDRSVFRVTTEALGVSTGAKRVKGDELAIRRYEPFSVLFNCHETRRPDGRRNCEVFHYRMQHNFGFEPLVGDELFSPFEPFKLEPAAGATFSRHRARRGILHRRQRVATVRAATAAM
jgi:hypothetical protein